MWLDSIRWAGRLTRQGLVEGGVEYSIDIQLPNK